MNKIILIFFSLVCSSAFAQTRGDTSTNKQDTTLRVVEILSAERYGYQKQDSLRELLLLVGGVKLKQENTLFYADSAVFNKNEKIVEAFKNVRINDNDSIDTYSDYLLYHTDTKIAILKKNVRLTDGKSNLYTEELEYDINQQIGIYRQGGKVVNGTSVLTSNEGTYYADVKDVYFKQDVKLKDPKYYLQSDSLLYNTVSEIATFITKTYIEDSAKRTIVTSSGYYDLKNKKATFGKRPVIKDKAVTIIANTVDTDDSTGISILTGNAIFKDSAQGVSVLANSIVSNRNTGSMLATQNPLMIIAQDKDSTYITADTLYSGRLDELTAVPDSVLKDSSINAFFTGKDSSLRKDSSGNNLSPGNDSILLRDSSGNNKLLEIDSLPIRNPVQETDSSFIKDSSANKFPANDSMSLRDSSVNKELLKKDSIPVSDSSINKPDREMDSLTVVDSALTTASPEIKNIPSIVDTVTTSDTIPLSSTDTAVQNRNDTAQRFFRAYHNVRIFSDSMQAVCDSLFYSGQDSIFRMFYDPILWASNSQVTGDTIYMYTKNKKPDELYVFEDGIMINKTGDDMFNQIRGTRLYGYFSDGEITSIRAKGNAESIYYAKDNEEKMVGINKASSNIIDMRFKNKELNRVVFISEVTGTMLPIRQATAEDKQLRGFNWQEAKRPKTKFELFGN